MINQLLTPRLLQTNKQHPLFIHDFSMTDNLCPVWSVLEHFTTTQ